MAGEQTDEIITLRHGEFGLSICPAAGGSITRYWQERDGRTIEWLRPASPRAIAARDPLGMASFPLVPFSSRIRDGRFVFDGHAVSLPLNFLPERHAIHGHGWQSPWDVVLAEEDTATIAYTHTADSWPWPYAAEQTVTLGDDGLSLLMTVSNHGDGPMPAGLGPHPYFVRTPGARITAITGRMWGSDAEVMPTELAAPVAGKDLNTGLVPSAVAMDNTFVDWDHRVEITWPEWRARLVMEAPAPLDHLVVFTPPGEDYFCVEPVSNITDAFNLAAAGRGDTGITVLEPDETLTGIIRFRPELIA